MCEERNSLSSAPNSYAGQEGRNGGIWKYCQCVDCMRRKWGPSMNIQAITRAKNMAKECSKGPSPRTRDFTSRLADWIALNNISVRASNDLFALLAEKINILPSNGAQSTITEEPSIISGADGATYEIAYLDEIFVQRNFMTMEEFEEFEVSLEDEETFKRTVNEFCGIGVGIFHKFIKSCWSKVFTKQIVQHFSWKGKLTKRCIRGSIVVLAIQAATKRKFPHSKDCDFEHVSRGYFQYTIYRLKNATRRTS